MELRLPESSFGLMTPTSVLLVAVGRSLFIVNGGNAGVAGMKGWAVGLFGMAGALLRYMTGVWVHAGWSSPFPLGTFAVNMSGCLALGWLSAWTAARPGMPAWLSAGISTGLIGSFTTFSTFSVETMELFRDGEIETAGLYVALSVVGGLACAWGGSAIYRPLARRAGAGGVAK